MSKSVGSSVGRGVSAKFVAVLGLAGLTVGCAARQVQANFRGDFRCQTAVTVEEIAMNRFRAEGCGREATYQCVGTTCVIQTVSEEEHRVRSEDASHARPEPSRQSRVKVKKNEDSGTVLIASIALDKSVILRLTAAPDRERDLLQVKLMRYAPDRAANKCGFDWMVNGQVLETPKPAVVREKNVLIHRVQVGPDIIDDLAIAEQLAFRSCDERWSLKPEQIMQVRELIARYREELAWKGKPRKGGSGGLMAPTGGWPEWEETGSAPAAAQSEALDPRELFKKLKVSVFQLEALRAGATAQGSAVAVNETELLTNCHVVEGATKLVLRQDKQEWVANLLRADPKSDRCVLTASGTRLTPVAGVRSYDSLEVGEVLYTLGSPSGLEFTLSDGILSGRREERGRHYVQTTAPISPGSSGGGLFDTSGNLVGITTLVLTGRKNRNQALNFAIPAESFWQE